MLTDRTTNISDKKCRFGLISDIHKDIMHDADDRLCAFIQKVQAEQVDFIMQLGDFCKPIPENQLFMNIWNQFRGPKYHVVGNHDTDGDGLNRPNGAYAFKPEETVEYWGIQERYYSFDLHGIHFIVLDGNDKAENPAPGYRRYIGSDQVKWLKHELNDMEFPVILFIHQSLERPGGIENQEEIRTLFESVNKEAGYLKVVACFSGHHHRDYVRRINGIIYPQINSASYYWMGGDYIHVRYSEEIDKKYPYIKYTAPYRDPLYTIVTVDLEVGIMKIEGLESEFVGPAPWEVGGTRESWEHISLRPAISDWSMPI